MSGQCWQSGGSEAKQPLSHHWATTPHHSPTLHSFLTRAPARRVWLGLRLLEYLWNAIAVENEWHFTAVVRMLKATGIYPDKACGHHAVCKDVD